LARRFFRAAHRVEAVAWRAAIGSDLRMPHIVASRPLPVRLVNSYLAKLLAAAATDPVVAARFVRVTGFLAAPTTLFRPSVLWRVPISPTATHLAATGSAASPARRAPLQSAARRTTAP